MDEVKFPEVEVQLVGQDGNAFAIIGAVTKELRRHQVDADTISQFSTEAMAGDYNHLLQTAQRWVTVY